MGAAAPPPDVSTCPAVPAELGKIEVESSRSSLWRYSYGSAGGSGQVKSACSRACRSQGHGGGAVGGKAGCGLWGSAGAAALRSVAGRLVNIANSSPDRLDLSADMEKTCPSLQTMKNDAKLQ